MRIYKLVFDLEPEESQDLFQISSFGRLNDCNFGFVLHDLELNKMECFWIFENESREGKVDVGAVGAKHF